MGDRFLCLCHHLPPFLPIFIIFTSVAQVIISQQIVNILRHPVLFDIGNGSKQPEFPLIFLNHQRIVFLRILINDCNVRFSGFQINLVVIRDHIDTNFRIEFMEFHQMRHYINSDSVCHGYFQMAGNAVLCQRIIFQLIKQGIQTFRLFVNFHPFVRGRHAAGTTRQQFCLHGFLKSLDFFRKARFRRSQVFCGFCIASKIYRRLQISKRSDERFLASYIHRGIPVMLIKLLLN